MKEKTEAELNREFAELEKEYRGYLITLAQKFGKISAPFGFEDYMDIGRVAIWKLLKKDMLGNVYQPKIFKLAIRSDMCDFHKSNVKRMRRKQHAVQEEFEVNHKGEY